VALAMSSGRAVPLHFMAAHHLTIGSVTDSFAARGVTTRFVPDVSCRSMSASDSVATALMYADRSIGMGRWTERTVSGCKGTPAASKNIRVERQGTPAQRFEVR